MMNGTHYTRGAFVSLAAALAGCVVAAWPMYRGGPQGAGAGGGSGATGQIAWITPAISGLDGAPIVGSDGSVYVASKFGKVYAFNGATGAERWRATCAPVLSTPALTASGTLLVMEQKGTVRAYDAATGDVEWERNLNPGGTGVAGAPIAVSAGTAYVTPGDRTVVAIEAATGATQWVARFGGMGPVMVLVGPSGHVLCITADRDAAMVRLDPATGAEQSRTLLGTGPTLAFAIAPDGTWITTSMGGVVRAANAATGQAKWQNAPSGTGATQAAVSPDRAFRIGSDRKVEALSLANGAVLWTFDCGPQGGRSGVTLDGAGRVYVGTSDGLAALDPSNGSVVWRLAGPLPTRPIAVGPNGWLYYVTGNKLVAVR